MYFSMKKSHVVQIPETLESGFELCTENILILRYEKHKSDFRKSGN